jgi:hypothetical protein
LSTCALGRFGSFASFGYSVGLWGFANVPNEGWHISFLAVRQKKIFQTCTVVRFFFFVLHLTVSGRVVADYVAVRIKF